MFTKRFIWSPSQAIISFPASAIIAANVDTVIVAESVTAGVGSTEDVQASFTVTVYVVVDVTVTVGSGAFGRPALQVYVYGSTPPPTVVFSTTVPPELQRVVSLRLSVSGWYSSR